MSSTQPIPVIAIDGPSASGKGTIAQHVAAALGFHYLDSGALYRAVALAALQAGANLENDLELSRIILTLSINFTGDRVAVGGHDVTEAIRDESVSNAASLVATYPKVRKALLARQRGLRQAPGLVAEGRDMGSVVFADAVLKIFLTASAEERAERRYKQLMGKGMNASMTTLLQDIRERDARDSARPVAPLQKCADAVLLDTTGVPVQAVVTQVLALYQKARQAP
ncbi:MAG: (d)CMP kinase [Betaproteobacteria bacterium]|nr:(d)CMP kinase [Betaproteobacteria bacterium]